MYITYTHIYVFSFLGFFCRTYFVKMRNECSYVKRKFFFGGVRIYFPFFFWMNATFFYMMRIFLREKNKKMLLGGGNNFPLTFSNESDFLYMTVDVNFT
jgi:hypothetical protein